jgi:4-hydroxythreonine-4-phosphate dehydrogenase
VPSLLTTHRLEIAIRLLHEGLSAFFQKTHPKIGICGLNPHAGESGLLGTEEQDFMVPLIKRLNQNGFHLEGPLAADTAFTEKKRQHFDAILAMYHDQGLAPIKALYFGETVNMTWGLPFLRTSVDHGTALDLAGTGKADSQSLSRAIALTIRLALAKSLTEKNKYE